MKNHRYQYLYIPVQQFLARLSPQTQVLLVIGKIALIIMLLGFDVAHATNLI